MVLLILNGIGIYTYSQKTVIELKKWDLLVARTLSSHKYYLPKSAPMVPIKMGCQPF